MKLKFWIKRSAGLLVLLLVISLVLPAAAAPVQQQEPAVPEFDGYLVGGLESSAVSLLGADEELSHVALDIYKTDDLQLARSLVDSGEAAYVEPDYYIDLFEEPVDPTPPVDPPKPSWSDDMQKLAYARNLGFTGKGITVGIIDTGIDPANANLRGVTILPGRCFVQGLKPDDTLDGQGHGTKVAQMIAGQGVGGMAWGTAPEAKLVPLRTFDKNGRGGFVDTLIEALEASVNDFGCNVINMSLGTKSSLSPDPKTGKYPPGYEENDPKDPMDLKSFHEAVQYVTGKGAIIVSASGNVNARFPQGSLIFPAAYPEVISVGALTKTGEIAGFSIQNEAVTVCGPGENLDLVRIPSDRAANSGTSFASPAIAGTVAVLKQLKPELTPQEAKLAIRSMALDLGEPGWDKAYGWGSFPMNAIFAPVWSETMELPPTALVGEWVLPPAGTTAFAATYDADGRMLDCNMGETLRGFYPSYARIDETADGGSCGFFLMMPYASENLPETQ